MRVRYVPGVGIVRNHGLSESKSVSIRRGQPTRGRPPSIGFIPETGEIAVRLSSRRVYRRRLYER